MSDPLSLRHRVLQSISQQRLWQPGDRVAVAVSGGLDSSVLLDVLLATSGAHGAQLSVVTVDHGQHEGSAEVAERVVALAARHGLACEALRCLPGGSDEGSLRAARYDAFTALEADRVALAHHRDDQAETLLLQLLRGAGSSGAGAMRSRRGRYVRPLLAEPRSALVAWAVARDLTWHEDPSNASARFTRNRLRHEVLPLLESLRPGASKALARSALRLQEDADYLRDRAEQVGDLRRVDELAALATPLLRRVLQRHSPASTSRHVDALVELVHGRIRRTQLPGGALASVRDGNLVVVPGEGSEP